MCHSLVDAAATAGIGLTLLHDVYQSPTLVLTAPSVCNAASRCKLTVFRIFSAGCVLAKACSTDRCGHRISQLARRAAAALHAVLQSAPNRKRAAYSRRGAKDEVERCVEVIGVGQSVADPSKWD